MSKESTLQAKIVNLIIAMGGKAIKTHGDQYLEKGTPDIFFCLRGRTGLFEIKKPGENDGLDFMDRRRSKLYDHEPTPIQHLRLCEWQAAGALVAVVRSVAEAEEVLFRTLPSLQP